ncbi:homeobox protein NOBOX isoform X1 [Erythrolamprus reginae]|uniref:homeobox protein NOBOX isoform X1 n=1 Tax=Erythrolamprus reginae TaxID=121349 RepID=UPI00396CBF94
MAMEADAQWQRRFPQQDAVYKAEFEEVEEKGGRESLLCTEEFVESENGVSTDSSLDSMGHATILGDPPGKILKKGNPEVSNEEEGGDSDREYYLDPKSESHLTQLTPVDPRSLVFYQPSNAATSFNDLNTDPPVPETGHRQEFVQPSKKVDQGRLNVKEKKSKKKAKAVFAKGPPKATGVGLESKQNPDVNQNLNHTRRSSRCATASNAGQPSFTLCSVLVSGNQDPEDYGLLEIVEEAVPPPRKKLRTVYNYEQLQELEKAFEEDRYPDNEQRREIAALVGVTPQRVMVWFQNRRAKWRKIEKLLAKNVKKYSLPAPVSPVDSQRMPQGTTVLAMAQVSDAANDQPNTVAKGPSTVNYSGPSITLPSSSAPLVTGKMSCYDSTLTKTTNSQGCFLGSLAEELFPAIPSPPPIRRTHLPFSLAFNSNHHILPLMLDDSLTSGCSPSSQESSSSEVFTYSVQSQSISSSMDRNYPEQLEPTINLETACFHSNSLPGPLQHSQYFHHELSHFPIHLSGNTLPSLQLTTAAPSYMPAFQPFPWNEFSAQGPPFTHSFSAQIPFSGLAPIVGSSTQKAPFAPNQALPASSCLLQLPKAPGPGAAFLFTTKPLVPTNPEPPFQPLAKMPAEGDSNPDDGPEQMESVSLPDSSEVCKTRLNFSPRRTGDEKTA